MAASRSRGAFTTSMDVDPLSLALGRSCSSPAHKTRSTARHVYISRHPRSTTDISSPQALRGLKAAHTSCRCIIRSSLLSAFLDDFTSSCLRASLNTLYTSLSLLETFSLVYLNFRTAC